MLREQEKTGRTPSYEAGYQASNRRPEQETAARMEYLLTFNAKKYTDDSASKFREAREVLETRIKEECDRLDEMLGKGVLSHADHRKMSSATQYQGQKEQSANDALEKSHMYSVENVRAEQNIMNDSPAAYVMASAVIAHGLDGRLAADGARGVLESGDFNDAWRRLLEIAQRGDEGQTVTGNAGFDQKITETVAALRHIQGQATVRQ